MKSLGVGGPPCASVSPSLWRAQSRVPQTPMHLRGPFGEQEPLGCLSNASGRGGEQRILGCRFLWGGATVGGAESPRSCLTILGCPSLKAHAPLPPGCPHFWVPNFQGAKHRAPPATTPVLGLIWGAAAGDPQNCQLVIFN